MKRFFVVLGTIAFLMWLVACPQPEAGRSSVGASGPRGTSTSLKSEIPVNVLKNTDRMTVSVREALVQATETVVGAAGEAMQDVAYMPNFVDWNISLGKTKEAALSESSVFKHLLVHNDGTVVNTDNHDTVIVSYADITGKLFGRDVNIGDEFWIAYKTLNHNGAVLYTMVQQFVVGNPSKLEGVTLLYGYGIDEDGKSELGWFLKATVEGLLPTTQASFYLGSDTKATLVNTTPANGHINTADDTTDFICAIPADMVKVGQPHHVKAVFKDVEATDAVADSESNFEAAEVFYAKKPSDIWGFAAATTLPNTDRFALATDRLVSLRTADPEFAWNDMKDSIVIFNELDKTNRIENEEYEVYISSANTTDANGFLDVNPSYTGATRSTNFQGLQYGKKYYVQVKYSFDLSGATGLARTEVASPIVSFTTLNGLQSPRYTFDTGYQIPNMVDMGETPTSLGTDGTIVNTGGNPSNALALENGEAIISAEVKRYARGKLVFDMILPDDIRDELFTTIFDGDNSNDSQNMELYYTTTGGGALNPKPADEDRAYYSLMTFVVGDPFNMTTFAIVELIYQYPFFTNDKVDYTTGTWTFTPGVLRWRLTNGTTTELSAPILSTDSILPVSNVDRSGLQGQAREVTTNFDISRPYTVDISFNKPDAPSATSHGKISVTTTNGYLGSGPAVTKDLDVTTQNEKYTGYKGFVLVSAALNEPFLIDNLQYTVVGNNPDNYVRSIW
ncbi:MAG: hypothetical protein GX220_04195 [Treponema sp.]|nr:hypothetical protein [Treponema sp.]